jgi:putative oxidoreductase
MPEMTIAMKIKTLHDGAFALLERLTDGWFLGLFARFVFLAVLYFYFLNSFGTKVGDDFAGFFQIQDGAWYQIAPLAMDAAGGDPAAVPFLPWHIIVPLGTYMELILPALVVVGLFTRLASIGMIGFIIVQTLTDIFGHMVDAQTIGALFDRFPDSLIADQRLLWSVPLVYLALKGAGLLSLDTLLLRLGTRDAPMHPAML